MVKQLDENNAGPDHVGIRLWGAYEAWKAEFVSAMVEAGHAWFTPSRATLLGFVPRTGLRQSDLIARMGISKQAVQQLVDGLEGEGVLERIADPDDKRGRVSSASLLTISASNEGGDFFSGSLAYLVGPVTAVVAGGVGAIVTVVVWARVFPVLRTTKTFDPPDDLLEESQNSEGRA